MCVREWEIIIICIFVFSYIYINKGKEMTLKVTHRSEGEWYGMGADGGWSETSRRIPLYIVLIF